MEKPITDFEVGIVGRLAAPSAVAVAVDRTAVAVADDCRRRGIRIHTMVDNDAIHLEEGH